MWTKLRPGVRDFLGACAQHFELHVSTMGKQLYAEAMARLLDPTGELFGGRVFGRGDDAGHDPGDPEALAALSKGLDAHLPGMEAAVLIVDDTRRVWPEHQDNLVIVERYHFWPSSCVQFGLDTKHSQLIAARDERAKDGMLATARDVVLDIRREAVAAGAGRIEPGGPGDARVARRAVRARILEGCCIVFSHVFPVQWNGAREHPTWQLAEELGAKCTTQLNVACTHIVTNHRGTQKVAWGLQNGKHVVRVAWLECCGVLWRRASEADFKV